MYKPKIQVFQNIQVLNITHQVCIFLKKLNNFSRYYTNKLINVKKTDRYENWLYFNSISYHATVNKNFLHLLITKNMHGCYTCIIVLLLNFVKVMKTYAYNSYVNNENYRYSVA